MDVQLNQGLGTGKTHAERIEVARRVVDLCLEKHGDKIAAICVYGSTAVDLDLPYSDLDLTVLTHSDLDDETRCFTHDGLTVNVDYQTLADTIEQEALVPGEGGCWTTALVLHDPEQVVEELRELYAGLTEEDFTRRFALLMADHLPSHMGKIRNGVLSNDRAYFLRALLNFGDKVCKALCLLNQKYVTGERAMLGTCRHMEQLPESFGERIQQVLGEVEASDQERYDAAEELWEGLQRLAFEWGIHWCSEQLPV